MKWSMKLISFILATLVFSISGLSQEFKSGEWYSDRDFRIEVRVLGGKKDVLVRLKFDFPQLLSLSKIKGRFDPDTIQVIECHSETKSLIVYDKGLKGNARFIIPSSYDSEEQFLYWMLQRDSKTHYYSIYFDLAGRKLSQEGKELIGRGEEIKHRIEDPVKMRLPIYNYGSGIAFPIDWDRDGITDLVISQKNFRGIEEVYYWYKNIGGNKKPLFSSKPIPLKDIPVTPGNLVDINGDGDIDFFGASPRVNHHLWIIGRNIGSDKKPKYELQKFNTRIEGHCIWDCELVDWNGDGVKDFLITTTGFSGPEHYDKPGRYWIGSGDERKFAGTYPAGKIFYLENTGNNEQFKLVNRGVLMIGEKPLRLTLYPYIAACDWDSDGDIDLIAGHYTETLDYIENAGSKEKSKLLPPVKLRDTGGEILRFGGQGLLFPEVCDWDKDGDLDLIVSGSAGWVSYVENIGNRSKPRLESMGYFCWENGREVAVSPGIFAMPAACDWDDDGDIDLICGNEAGTFTYFENVGNREEYRFKDGVWMQADGKLIKFNAGPKGAENGPCEFELGYTSPDVIDWDNDGDLDILTGNILGYITFFANVGSKKSPKLSAGKIVKVDGKVYRTTWRTRPGVADWNDDGLLDLVLPDRKGFIWFFERYQNKVTKELELMAGKKLFLQNRAQIRPNAHVAYSKTGRYSGRMQFEITDLDEDGDFDILVGRREGGFVPYIRYYENVGSNSSPVFADRGNLWKRLGTLKHPQSYHSLGVEAVDWNGDGSKEMLIMAPDFGNLLLYRKSFFNGLPLLEVEIESAYQRKDNAIVELNLPEEKLVELPEVKWTEVYEADKKPQDSGWEVKANYGDKEVSEQIRDGILILDSQGPGFWSYTKSWDIDHLAGGIVEARLRVVNNRGSPCFGVVIAIANGPNTEVVRFETDKVGFGGRFDCPELRYIKDVDVPPYKMDTTYQLHTYRIRFAGQDISVYLKDEKKGAWRLILDGTGRFKSGYKGNFISFGRASSHSPGKAEWDYVRYHRREEPR